MNTQKHNQRKRDRGKRNLFWLVKSTLVGSEQLILYNRKPYKINIAYSKYAINYYDKLKWFSGHSEYYVNGGSYNKDLANKFNITHNDLIPVRLVRCDYKPNLFIKRKKENLFISNETIKIVRGTGEEILELQAPSRISPKLFPEVTEKSGIVGVVIEAIK